MGVLLFFAVNSFLQKKAREIAPTKDASDCIITMNVHTQFASAVAMNNAVAPKKSPDLIDKNSKIW